MPSKAILLFVGASLLGLAAVVVARVFLVQPAASSPATVAIAAPNAVVAATDIPAGTPIIATKLKQVSIPAAALPAGAFPSIADAVGKGDRTAVRRIDANELVLVKAVSGGGGRLSTSGAIATRLRAVAVRVGDVAGVGGLLSPGDRVDILVTRTLPSTLGGPAATEVQTDLIVQSARILAVDQDTDPVREGADKAKVPATVTVEVDVEQAQKLALAQTVGAISLMLRTNADLGVAASRTIRLSDLRTGGGPRATAPHRSRPQPRRWSPHRAPTGGNVEVVRGMDAKNYTLPVSR